MKKLLVSILAILGIAGGGYGAFNYVSSGTYTLAGGGIGASDTSIIVDNFTKPISGNQYVMAVDFGSIGYLTLEPGSVTNKEFVSFTGISYSGNRATLTGVTRGLEFNYPYTSSSTLQLQHSGGTKVIVSNPPQLYNQLATKANTESITGPWTFASTAPPRYDSTTVQHTGTYIATTSEFASIDYVNAIALASAPNAADAVKGVVEMATAAEAAAGTSQGSTAARLALGANLSTSSPTAAGCSTFCIVLATAGKIAQAFIDLTTSYIWTGFHTFAGGVSFTATSTFSATTTAATSTQPTGFKSIFQLVSGASITASVPQAVTLATSSGRVFLADGDVSTTTDFYGFALTSASSGSPIQVQTTGVVTGFSGLTAGTRYYVQDTAGSIGSSVGTSEVYAGIAISATELALDPLSSGHAWQYLGTQSLTCPGDTVINQPLARFAMIKVTGSNTAGAVADLIMIAKVGITQVAWNDQQATPASGGNVGSTWTWTSTTSIRAVNDGNNTPTCTGTAYYYR